MRFVIQRVMHSKVTINGEVRGQIGKGFYGSYRSRRRRYR